MKQTAKKVCDNIHEKTAWEENRLLLGIDEAGRGALAGPMAVAGVVFPQGYDNPDIYDSKALSAAKREKLFDIICHDAVYYEIRFVYPEEIDRKNIYRADQDAMTAIAEDIPVPFVLTDAMPLKLQDTSRDVLDIVKGDRKSVSIAAASILAKVSRDRLMVYYDSLWPAYGFGAHKGYGTAQHLEAIEANGITPIHRRSFAPASYHQEQLDLF